MDRLGVGYALLAGRNPKLVYAAIRGFGDPRTGESPYRDWPAYDVVAEAMGGLVSITGTTDGTVVKCGPFVGDIFTGTLNAVGLLAAVIHARATGEGQFVDVAMYDAVLSLCEGAGYSFPTRARRGDRPAMGIRRSHRSTSSRRVMATVPSAHRRTGCSRRSATAWARPSSPMTKHATC